MSEKNICDPSLSTVENWLLVHLTRFVKQSGGSPIPGSLKLIDCALRIVRALANDVVTTAPSRVKPRDFQTVFVLFRAGSETPT